MSTLPEQTFPHRELCDIQQTSIFSFQYSKPLKQNGQTKLAFKSVVSPANRWHELYCRKELNDLFTYFCLHNRIFSLPERSKERDKKEKHQFQTLRR